MMRGLAAFVGALAALMLAAGSMQYVDKLEPKHVDMLTTGLTLALVLLPLAIIGAVVVFGLLVVITRRETVPLRQAMPLAPVAQAMAAPAAAPWRIEPGFDLDQRRKLADTRYAEARADKAASVLAGQNGHGRTRAIRPGPWVEAEEDTRS